MELHLLINGQKCEIKFEKHHTFERVIYLLKQNKVIPPELEFDKIQIIGKDGKNFTKNNHVIQSLVPPDTNKCQVRIKYAHSSISSILNNSKDSMVESQGVKKARLVDIIKGFFQKMQKHEFKKLEKYQNHHEEIVSQVAKFAAKYQKLYALNLYYKDKIIKLNQKQAEQLQEYSQKFRELFKRQEQEGYSNLRQIIKNDSIFQQETSRIECEVRETIQQKSRMIQWLQEELQGQKIILQEAVNSYTKEISELDDKLTKKQQKWVELNTTVAMLRQQTNNLNIQLKEYQNQIRVSCIKVKSLSEKNNQLMTETQISRNEINQLLFKFECQMQQKQIFIAQLESKYHLSQIKIGQIQNRNHILQDQKQTLTKNVQKLERQLQQSKEESVLLSDTSCKLKKINSLHLTTKRSTSFLEEIPYQQPTIKLNECFNSDIANKFIQKQQQYLGKRLTKLTKIIHHPATLNIPPNKILKKLKGKSNILLVCVTQQDKVVGGFSSLAIDHFCTKEDLKVCKAFIFTIEDGQIYFFTLKEGRYPVKYDLDFFILGQEEITIDYLTLTLQSRLVTMGSQSLSFQDPHQKRKFLLSTFQRSFIKLKEYWMFDCTFQ